MRLLLNPLAWALMMGAVAALAGWYAVGQRDRARDAEAALEAADRTIKAVNDYAYELTGIEAGLREQLEALANVPDTDSCGPSVRRALDLLRGPAP